MSSSTTQEVSGKLALNLPDRSSQLTSQEKPVLRENGNIFINSAELNRYLEQIPEKEFGDWRIDSSVFSEFQSATDKLKLLHSPLSFPETYVPPGWYKRLCMIEEKSIMMSNTWAEIGGHYELFMGAHGRVLMNGLGLGIAAWVVDKLPEVEEIVVQEIDQEIIDAVMPTLQAHSTKVSVFRTDAWNGLAGNDSYNYIWHDIWPTYTPENIQEFNDIRCLYREYIENPKEQLECQGCWSEELSHAIKWRGDFV